MLSVTGTLSMRSFARIGSSLSVHGCARFGSVFCASVLDFVHLGSSLSYAGTRETLSKTPEALSKPPAALPETSETLPEPVGAGGAQSGQTFLSGRIHLGGSAGIRGDWMDLLGSVGIRWIRWICWDP